MPEEIVSPHGGYRSLKTFQLARLSYDLTVRFCDLYIDPRSRTHDQMVQAARSGVQNIAEGSQASGTSKKFEMKLTSLARASLEELRLDYEDYLRHRGLQPWPPEHPALMRFKAKRCATLEELRAWVEEERSIARTNTDRHGLTQTEKGPKPATPLGLSVSVSAGPCASVAPPTRTAPYSAQLVANAVLSLMNLCCHLLDKQIAAQAEAFTREGGFTERLYRARSQARGR